MVEATPIIYPLSPFAEGWIAYRQGKGERANPYPQSDPKIGLRLEWLGWRAGWHNNSAVSQGFAEGTLAELEQEWKQEPWNQPRR